MKPKEWLFQNGHIKEIGRGRMSAAHKALIMEALEKNSNLVIEGFSSSKPTAQSPKPAVTREPKVASSGMIDCPEPLRDARDFVVVLRDTGKPIPMVGPATVCNGCHSSLTYCPCPAPRVWLDHDREGVVSFKNVS